LARANLDRHIDHIPVCGALQQVGDLIPALAIRVIQDCACFAAREPERIRIVDRAEACQVVIAQVSQIQRASDHIPCARRALAVRVAPVLEFEPGQGARAQVKLDLQLQRGIAVRGRAATAAPDCGQVRRQDNRRTILDVHAAETRQHRYRGRVGSQDAQPPPRSSRSAALRCALHVGPSSHVLVRPFLPA